MAKITVFSLQALEAEIVQDPLQIGYLDQSDAQKAALINADTGPGAGSVFLHNASLSSILSQLTDPTDFDLITQPGAVFNGIYVLSLLTPLNFNNVNIQNLVMHVLNQLTPGSMAAVTAVIEKIGSRAENLWGEGTIITEQQIGQARNGP